MYTSELALCTGEKQSQQTSGQAATSTVRCAPSGQSRSLISQHVRGAPTRPRFRSVSETVNITQIMISTHRHTCTHAHTCTHIYLSVHNPDHNQHTHTHTHKHTHVYIYIYFYITKIIISTHTHKLFIYMNTCQEAHLNISPKCFTMATIALFSASECKHTQTIINIHITDGEINTTHILPSATVAVP